MNEGTKLDRKHCVGCEDDFYNGNNPYGIQECWGRTGAKFDNYRLVHVDLPPPYLGLEIQKLPTCYKKKRHVKVKPEALDSRGFWRSA